MRMINIEMAINIIQRYIYEMKGVLVNIIPPQIPQQEELFIKAFNIACAYYDIII